MLGEEEGGSTHWPPGHGSSSQEIATNGPSACTDRRLERICKDVSTSQALTVPTFHSVINCPLGTGTWVTETTGTEAGQGCLYTYGITVL